MKKQSVKQPRRLLVIRMADIEVAYKDFLARGIAHDYEKTKSLYEDEIEQFKRAIKVLAKNKL